MLISPVRDTAYFYPLCLFCPCLSFSGPPNTHNSSKSPNSQSNSPQLPHFFARKRLFLPHQSIFLSFYWFFLKSLIDKLILLIKIPNVIEIRVIWVKRLNMLICR